MIEIITVVDKNDKVIGSKERGTELLDDIYRVVCLWVENSEGKILLAKRASTKVHNPGKWCSAVTGTVAYDDSYDETMVREAMEELGIVGAEFHKIIKKFVQTNYKYFAQYYKVILDYDLDKFVVQDDEVAEIRWFSELELQQMFHENPEKFVDSMPEVLKIYLPNFFNEIVNPWKS